MRRNIFNVMTDPRGFIRSLPKNKMGSMPVYLAWVIGMIYLLRAVTGFNLSSSYSFFFIILVTAILAIIVGYIYIYIFTFFLYWAGKLFKGKATYNQLFSATAFGRVPEIFVLLSWFLLVVYFGQDSFSIRSIRASGSLYITALLFAQVIFYVWGFVITLHTVGEVQKFSAWMSLWNYILAGVLVVLVSLLIEFIVAIIFSLDMYGVDSVSKVVGLII